MCVCVLCVLWGCGRHGFGTLWKWRRGGRGGPGQLPAAGSLSSGVCGSLIIILAPDRGSCVVLGEADRQ